jgi:hypothetical protein
MPVSKRNKIGELLFTFIFMCVMLFSLLVSLTKTTSKGKTLKTKLAEVLRQAVDEYKRLYVFSYNNIRTSKFRDVRMDWKESK